MGSALSTGALRVGVQPLTCWQRRQQGASPAQPFVTIVLTLARDAVVTTQLMAETAVVKRKLRDSTVYLIGSYSYNSRSSRALPLQHLAQPGSMSLQGRPRAARIHARLR